MLDSVRKNIAGIASYLVLQKELKKIKKVEISFKGDDRGQTPLIVAAMSRSYSVIEILLKTKECDIACVDSNGNTALIHAVLKKSLPMVIIYIYIFFFVFGHQISVFVVVWRSFFLLCLCSFYDSTAWDLCQSCILKRSKVQCNKIQRKK